MPDRGLTNRISWHRVGMFGCLFTIVAALAASLPASSDANWSDLWIWTLAWVVLITAAAVLLPRSPVEPSVVWPVLALGELATLLLIDTVVVGALSGLFALTCLYSGLTRSRRTAWWVAVPCTAIFFETLHFPVSITVVRTVIVSGVFVAVSGIPAILLDRVRRQEEQLNVVAATDPLTGLRNRRDLDGLLEHWRGRGSVALLDIDHFKAFNDEHGHGAGDQLLRSFATFLRAECRAGDELVRFGGEEFLVLLPMTDLDGATATVRRWLDRWSAEGADHPTFSAGVAPLTDGASVRNADAALYQAKRAGRNRVVVWPGDALAPETVEMRVAPARLARP
jgi:diguanylate cyclase (GGDEF)-like protein